MLKISLFLVFTQAFAFDYQSSLEGFRQKVKQIPGGEHRIHVHTEGLATDSFYLPSSDSQELIVITSGIHGVEAPIGSRLQQALLEKISSGLEIKKSLLLIHLLNPYGFKNSRRVNLKNVDLNRNFFLANSFKNLKNRNFKKFSEKLGPQQKVGSLFLNKVKLVFFVLKKIIMREMTFPDIRQAIAGGQWSFPKAPFYGGNELQPESLLFIQLFRQYGQKYKKITFLDIHTGLGDKEVLHLIENKKQNAFSLSHPNIKVTNSQTPGFYATQGDITDIPYEIFPEKEILSLTVEFGTSSVGPLSQLSTLSLTVLENQGHHYGFKNKFLEKKIKDQFRNHFYPQDSQWQKQAMTLGLFLFSQLLVD